MALDIVASRPEIQFFATEAERLALCDAMGVSRDQLPRQSARLDAHVERSWYFPGNGLIGALQDVSGPVLTCVYIDDGASSTPAFQSYLRRYAPLLAAIPRFRLLHAAVDARAATAASAIVRRAFGHDLATPALGASKDVDGVREYFQLRQAYEAQRWAALDTAKLDRFRALRFRFKTALDPLYTRWMREGEAVFMEGAPLRLETMVLPPFLCRDRGSEAPVVTAETVRWAVTDRVTHGRPGGRNRGRHGVPATSPRASTYGAAGRGRRQCRNQGPRQERPRAEAKPRRSPL